MLRSFRDSIKGRTGKVLLAIIIVPFVLFGAESLLTGGGGAATVLEVNGEEIDAVRLAQEMAMLRNETAARMGEDVDYAALTDERLRPQAIERLTQSVLIAQTFEDLSLSAPERMIQQSIVQTPDFQVDGKFSNTQMTRVLADNGFNLNMLKQRLAEDMRFGQLRSAIGQSSFVAEANTALLQKIFNEKRRVDWIEMDVEQVQVEDPGDDELRAYFEQNRAEFVTPRTVDAEYLLIDQANLVEDIDEAEVRAEYEQQMLQFEAGERRLVAHILLEVNERQSEEQAVQRARELAARISGGERFADLAQQYSADTVTAEDGGELGFSERDGTFPETFETAAFALEQGAVSEPVLTDAGVHLVTVTDIDVIEQPEYEEIRATIADQLQRRNALGRFATLLESVRDVAFNAADLRQPAKVAGVEVQAISGITVNGLQGEAASIEIETIFRNPAVLTALFSAEVLEDKLNSEMVELSDTQAVVLRVAKVNEPRQQSFQEVSEQIVARVRNEKIATALAKLAADVGDEIRGGETFAAVAEKHRLTASEDTELGRQSREAPQDLRDAIFERSRGEIGSGIHIVADANGRHFVYRVNEIIEDAEIMDEQEKAFFAQQIAAMTANQEIAAYVQSLREGAEIKQF
ncbi:MAG: SurA N-terminal domain-containing protein [Pseudomonadales bacterium]